MRESRGAIVVGPSHGGDGAAPRASLERTFPRSRSNCRSTWSECSTKAMVAAGTFRLLLRSFRGHCYLPAPRTGSPSVHCSAGFLSRKFGTKLAFVKDNGLLRKRFPRKIV